jgi:hypothetical protein
MIPPKQNTAIGSFTDDGQTRAAVEAAKHRVTNCKLTCSMGCLRMKMHNTSNSACPAHAARETETLSLLNRDHSIHVFAQGTKQMRYS